MPERRKRGAFRGRSVFGRRNAVRLALVLAVSPLVVATATHPVWALAEGVSCGKGVMSAKLTDVTAHELSRILREGCGLELRLPPGVRERRGTVSFEGLPIERAIETTLREFGLASRALVFVEGRDIPSVAFALDSGTERTPARITVKTEAEIPYVPVKVEPQYIPPESPPVYIPAENPPVVVPITTDPVYIPPAEPPKEVPPAVR